MSYDLKDLDGSSRFQNWVANISVDLDENIEFDEYQRYFNNNDSLHFFFSSKKHLFDVNVSAEFQILNRFRKRGKLQEI
jgi:hypothetical protein